MNKLIVFHLRKKDIHKIDKEYILSIKCLSTATRNGGGSSLLFQGTLGCSFQANERRLPPNGSSKSGCIIPAVIKNLFFTTYVIYYRPTDMLYPFSKAFGKTPVYKRRLWPAPARVMNKTTNTSLSIV